MHLIFRPTRREREERLAESRAHSSDKNIRGVVRTTEEAYEIQRQHAREGEEFSQPYAVSGWSKEAQQAEFELMQRSGIRPEDIEQYQSHERRREPSRAERLRTPFAWEHS